MKKFIVITAVLFLAAGAASAKGYEVQKKAGEYDVTVSIDKNPPVTGDNTVRIEIKDASGNPVKDAQVKIEYSMPAMPGMPPMNYKGKAVPQGDGYQMTMNLSMAGPWNISVKITRGGKTSSLKFTVDAK